jgi:glycosyltransferase involved in cell wall biosynthesis
MISKHTLCFFTDEYPFGKGETFIENELNYIAPHFKKVYLFHTHISDECREIPKNVELIYIKPPLKNFDNLLAVKNLFTLVVFFFQELFFSRQKKLFVKNIKDNIHYMLNCIYYAQQIKNQLSEDVLQNAVFYSYWFFDWNLSLSILKQKKIITKNITRAHRFDLYENNGKPNYLPLRKFCLKYTDKILVISTLGETYLKTIYPKYTNKIFCSYLGTKDFGFNPLPHNNTIHIVSCSNVNAGKRVHLIIEILKHINKNVLWTHFGDGKLFDTIKQEAKKLPPNITVEFKGRLSQQEIFDFYLQTPVDVFINTSISEGLPVSIMEAISFAIPVVATNVGGTSEIVNNQTGLLIEKDFDVKKVADWIAAIKQTPDIKLYRKNIKTFWQKNFNAESNYEIFFKQLNF